MDVHQCPRCNTRFRGEMTTCPVDGEPLQRLHDPLLGRTIAGRYLIEDKIGSGGMGVVYRATHEAIGRDVAIKFLHTRHTRDPMHRRRFLGEARAANQINHENIIDITDFGETDDGMVYLVMEHLQGRSLDKELAGRPLAPARALRIAIQVASGLARAHELDVIHRDVKPGNVFLVRRRNVDGDWVKLLDFGIAHFERELRITDSGTLLGTPEYIAPEQIRTGVVNAFTDLYALGCVLFEMLVGEPPFQGNMTEILVQQLRDPAPPPSQRSPTRGLPVELDALVLKMLAKDPRQRHRDAFHLVEELRAQLARMQDDPNSSRAHDHGIDDIDERRWQYEPPPREAAAEGADGIAARAGRPTMHMPLERDDWGVRVVQYRQALHLLHPDGGAPQPVQQAMQALERTVAEAARIRSSLHGAAEELAGSQAELRATRLRVGRALDELSSDESKLARADEQRLAALRHAEADASLALHGLLSRQTIGAIALTRGHALSDEDAISLQGLALVIERVRDSQLASAHLQRAYAEHRAHLDDVRFQIEQLKLRFAALNATSSEAHSAVENRVHTAEIQLRGELERIVAQAECVATHLRAHGQARPATEPPVPRVS